MHYSRHQGVSILPDSPFALGKELTLDYVKLGVHIWVSVLIMGTMWRLLQYHLIASNNQNAQHLGRAMALQY